MKNLLKERFQQLAGIKPLYELEDPIDSQGIDFPEMDDEFEGYQDAMLGSDEEYLQGVIDDAPEEFLDLNGGYYEVALGIEQGRYSAEEAVELAKSWAKEKLTGLSENKLLKENTNPIWTIGSFEDSADISDAGPEYKTAVINIIKAKHPDISDKDLEASIEVMNVTWYNEARSNSKGSDPEEMEVSAEDFADGAIEHYEDVIVWNNNNLAEGKLLKGGKYSIGDKLETYGGGEEVTVIGIKPNLEAALNDTDNPKAVGLLKKAMKQDFIDSEDRNKPFYFVKFEDGTPSRYWVESELK